MTFSSEFTVNGTRGNKYLIEYYLMMLGLYFNYNKQVEKYSNKFFCGRVLIVFGKGFIPLSVINQSVN
jgi:hypothetical protein